MFRVQNKCSAQERIIYFFLTVNHTSNLVKPLGWAHGALDVERTDVLPMLLEQRHQEVDGQMDVLNQLVLCHVHVPNSDVEAQHLKKVPTLKGLYKFG